MAESDVAKAFKEAEAKLFQVSEALGDELAKDPEKRDNKKIKRLSTEHANLSDRLTRLRRLMGRG